MGFRGGALVHSLTSRCDRKDLGQGGIQPLDELLDGGAGLRAIGNKGERDLAQRHCCLL